jgi:outer membrane protein OmpA-like peptidoglycan-associated protein
MKINLLSYIALMPLMVILVSGCAATPKKPSMKEEIVKIEKEAKEIRMGVEELIRKNPDTIMKDFIAELDRVLEHAEKVKDNPTPVDVAAVSRVVNTIKFNMELEKVLNQTVKTDFDPGEYELFDLSEEGKSAIKQFTDHLIAVKEDFARKYTDQLIAIKIKIVGYTDQVDFREKTSLIKKLTEGVEDKLPQNQPERRQFLNQRLSLFRAKSIDQYIKQLLAGVNQETSQIQIEVEVEGKGEEIPTGVTSPYLASDPRRRICRVSAILKSTGKELLNIQVKDK